MTIKVRGKKQFTEKIREYRLKGYNLITLGDRLAELENENEIVIIER